MNEHRVSDSAKEAAARRLHQASVTRCRRDDDGFDERLTMASYQAKSDCREHGQNKGLLDFLMPIRPCAKLFLLSTGK